MTHNDIAVLLAISLVIVIGAGYLGGILAIHSITKWRADKCVLLSSIICSIIAIGAFVLIMHF